MPFIDLDTGIRMHYRDGGEGTPMLFIPGLAATLDTWSYQVQGLSEKFRVVCIDMRGHGDSDKPYSSYSLDEMCGDIRALLQAFDLRDVVLVGWSTGAAVALNYVSGFDDERRIGKLVMLAPATPGFLATETEPFGMDGEIANATLEGMCTALPETMAAFSGVNFHRDDMQATAEWFLASWLKMPAYVGYRYFRTLVESDLRDRLGLVKIPTLICHGRHDQVCHPGWSEYMLPRIRNCRMVWFENSGHALMVEEPDKLSEELAEFASA